MEFMETADAAAVPAEYLEGLEAFLAWLSLERDLSPRTLDAYGRDLGQAAAWFSGQGYDSWSDLDALAAGSFLAELTARGLSTATLARKRSALRTLARFLLREGRLGANFMESVAGPRVLRKLPGSLTPEQLEALLRAPGDGTPGGLRDCALLELLYGCGLRVSEALGLNLEDVELRALFVRVMGKGSKPRLVPFGPPAGRAVERYLDAGRPALTGPRTGSALFISNRGTRLSRKTVWARLKGYAARAGLQEPVKPHLMRHSFATHLLQNGADLRVIQELLGHANISTTEIYTQIDKAALREEHARYHPRRKMG